MPHDVHERTAVNRRRIADLYDSTDRDLLDGPSLCQGWSLRTLLGHVVMPLAISPALLAWHALRRGSVHRASTVIATDMGKRPITDLTALLRERASRRVAAPGVGPMGQFVDGCIHLNDAARPLGRESRLPLDDWELVLPWLPSRAAALGHVPRGLLDGLTWQATDVDWSYGTGPAVVGAAEPLALAMTGRSAALPHLDGPGIPVLQVRLERFGQHR